MPAASFPPLRNIIAGALWIIGLCMIPVLTSLPSHDSVSSYEVDARQTYVAAVNLCNDAHAYTAVKGNDTSSWWSTSSCKEEVCKAREKDFEHAVANLSRATSNLLSAQRTLRAETPVWSEQAVTLLVQSFRTWDSVDQVLLPDTAPEVRCVDQTPWYVNAGRSILNGLSFLLGGDDILRTLVFIIWMLVFYAILICIFASLGIALAVLVFPVRSTVLVSQFAGSFSAKCLVWAAANLAFATLVASALFIVHTVCDVCGCGCGRKAKGD